VNLSAFFVISCPSLAGLTRTFHTIHPLFENFRNFLIEEDLRMKMLAVVGVVAGLVIAGISIAYAFGVLPKNEQSSPSATDYSFASSESKEKLKSKGGVRE
jgi:hypothetical protein